MPEKPLPKKVLERLRKPAAVRALERHLGMLENADHRTLGGKKLPTSMWGGRVRSLRLKNPPMTVIVNDHRLKPVACR